MAGPFAGFRQQNFFGSPVDRGDMSDFNPAMDVGDNPYQYRTPSYFPEPPTSRRMFGQQLDPKEPDITKKTFTQVNPTRAQPQVSFNPPQLDTSMPQEDPSFSANNYFDQIMKLRSRENQPKRTAYEAALEDRPKPEEYEPSKWRRLAAIFGGIGGGLSERPELGVQVAHDIISQPYQRVMNNYAQRIGNLKEEAGIEAKDLDDQVESLKTAHDLGIKYADVGIKQGTLGVAQAGAKTARLTAESQANYRLAQIERMLDQTQDEEGRRYLEWEKNNILREQAASQDRLRRAQAGLAGAQAGVVGSDSESRRIAAEAARGQAHAAEVRADRAGQPRVRNPTGADYTRAKELALADLMVDPRFAGKGVITQDNRNKYKITDAKYPGIDAALKEKTEEYLKKMTYGGGVGPSMNFFGDTGDSDFEPMHEEVGGR